MQARGSKASRRLLVTTATLTTSPLMMTSVLRKLPREKNFMITFVLRLALERRHQPGTSRTTRKFRRIRRSELSKLQKQSLLKKRLRMGLMNMTMFVTDMVLLARRLRTVMTAMTADSTTCQRKQLRTSKSEISTDAWRNSRSRMILRSDQHQTNFHHLEVLTGMSPA